MEASRSFYLIMAIAFHRRITRVITYTLYVADRCHIPKGKLAVCQQNTFLQMVFQKVSFFFFDSRAAETKGV